MKLLTLLLLFLFSQNIYAQLTTRVVWTNDGATPAIDVIYHDINKNLDWNNFSGKPPTDNGVTAALTVSGFGYSANIKTVNGKGQLNIQVYCYFNKNKSWVKPGRNTAYILSHEQHHFDISYICAAIFVDKLRGTVFNNANYSTRLPEIYNESCDIMNKMQNDYDGQTKNGQVKAEQARWNALIVEKIRAATR